MLKHKLSVFDDYNKIMANIDHPKVSKNIMTKYEFDQIISLRTTQISLGSPAFVDVSDLKIHSNMELRKIALREIKEGKLPFIIKRPLPNNKFEYFRIGDMDFTAVKYMMI